MAWAAVNSNCDDWKAVTSGRSVASPLATVTATTTVSAAAATTTAAAAVPASTAAGRPCFAWSGFVHGQWSTFDCLAIEFRYGVLSFLVRTHRDESKAARFAGESVLHKSDFLHSSSL
jgi:hypothetical protein